MCIRDRFSLAFHFGNAHGSGPRGGQEHPSCSPAGFQQPRSCEWISFCPSWEQLYPANSWTYVRYCSILMLAKVFRPCFFNLLWNLSCWSSSSLPLDSWCATFPTVWALSRSFADFRRRYSKSFSARNTCTLHVSQKRPPFYFLNNVVKN